MVTKEELSSTPRASQLVFHRVSACFHRALRYIQVKRISAQLAAQDLTR
jgi:hypothetical protein